MWAFYCLLNTPLYVYQLGNKNPANPTQNSTFSSYLTDYPRVALCRV